MKRLFSLILTLSLVMSMGVTAFAAENEGETGVGTGDYNADVTGTYVAGGKGETVFSVDVKWGGLSFTYNEAGKTWNAKEHKYDTTEAGWAESTGKIEVTNHSNTAITATPTWKAADGYGSAGMKFYNGNDEVTCLDIASAEPGKGETTGSAQTGTFTVKPSGNLPNTTTENATIGTITVTIKEVSIVSTAEELKTAVAAGGTVKLANDITYGDQLRIATATTVILDLNGHDLTFTYSEPYPLAIQGDLTIRGTSGGVISNTAEKYLVSVVLGDLTVESGTINSNGTISIVATGGNVTVSGGTINKKITNDPNVPSTIVITGGTFGFDPSDYVVTGYAATDNGDGTWTVTKEAAE